MSTFAPGCVPRFEDTSANAHARRAVGGEWKQHGFDAWALRKRLLDGFTSTQCTGLESELLSDAQTETAPVRHRDRAGSGADARAAADQPEGGWRAHGHGERLGLAHGLLVHAELRRGGRRRGGRRADRPAERRRLLRRPQGAVGWRGRASRRHDRHGRELRPQGHPKGRGGREALMTTVAAVVAAAAAARARLQSGSRALSHRLPHTSRARSAHFFASVASLHVDSFVLGFYAK